MTDQELRLLIDQGHQQTSGTYGHVARLPEGQTGLQALDKHDPEMAKIIRNRAEQQAARHYRRVIASGKNKVMLSPADLRRFRQLGGEVA